MKLNKGIINEPLEKIFKDNGVADKRTSRLKYKNTHTIKDILNSHNSSSLYNIDKGMWHIVYKELFEDTWGIRILVDIIEDPIKLQSTLVKILGWGNNTDLNVHVINNKLNQLNSRILQVLGMLNAEYSLIIHVMYREFKSAAVISKELGETHYKINSIKEMVLTTLRDDRLLNYIICETDIIDSNTEWILNTNISHTDRAALINREIVSKDILDNRLGIDTDSSTKIKILFSKYRIKHAIGISIVNKLYLNKAFKIDCEKYAEEVKSKLKIDVNSLEITDLNIPKLLIITVGDRGEDLSYIRGREKDCDELGISTIRLPFRDDATEEYIISNIRKIQAEYNCHAAIIQLPIPDKYNLANILKEIKSEQDVDGVLGNGKYIPCTAQGVIDILDWANINISGKHMVIVGRSNVVGKPLAKLALDKDATVTICHSKTQGLQNITKMADILVVAAGVKGLIQPDMVKDGVVLIDVGINVDEQGKVYGDIDRECYYKSSAYTTVPKGIGLVTRVTLLKNIIDTYKNS